MQLVSEHALQAQDFITMHAEMEQCLSTVPIQTLPEPLTSKLTAMRQQLLNTPFTECITPAMRAQLQLLLSSAASPSPALKDAPGSDVLAFQLAEALGLGLSAEAANPGALRREQEALALEKRKAQEGRDLAQAKVVEQLGAQEGRDIAQAKVEVRVRAVELRTGQRRGRGWEERGEKYGIGLKRAQEAQTCAAGERCFAYYVRRSRGAVFDSIEFSGERKERRRELGCTGDEVEIVLVLIRMEAEVAPHARPHSPHIPLLSFPPHARPHIVLIVLVLMRMEREVAARASPNPAHIPSLVPSLPSLFTLPDSAGADAHGARSGSAQREAEARR
ncbi:unnamed protein product [Closterium sp. Naga37s-1]|nr:unnamed protein product [Closterium sp. Naga37s-1]